MLDQPAAGDVDPRDTIPFLASDALQGRGVGLPGLDRAGDFIAGEFAAAGLKPLPGKNDFFQSFNYTAASSPAPSTSLTIASHRLILGDEFTPLSFSATKKFSGDVVFAGYGISAPEAGYDDYADVDVKGKIVIALRFEPTDEHGKSRLLKPGDQAAWSKHASFGAKVAAARKHGAAALLLVTPPEQGGDVLLRFSEASAAGQINIPVLNIRRVVADGALRQGANTDLKAIRQTIDSDFAPHSIALTGVAASGNVEINHVTTRLRNVVACIPGQGPAANEFVVVGAHYDHLGFGLLGHQIGPVGPVYHGADDNASGTATVVELASRFARRSAALPRTLVFICFSGEEEGLIGSKYFVDDPPIPLDKIVAMLNFDMVGRVRDETLFVGGQGTAGDFDSILASAQQHSKFTVKSVGRGGMGPSDHMAFAMKRIPVMFLFSGIEVDYHRPTDIASKINFAGIQEVEAFATDVIDGMLHMPRGPYVLEADQDSFNMFGTDMSTSRPTRRVILGIVPEYNSENSMVGVLVASAIPGTPADAGGLKSGDLLVQFGDQKIQNLTDLTLALNQHKPGEKVTIKFLRDKNSMTAEITLAARND